MKVEKRGLVFSPNKEDWWQMKYAILPTPYYISELNTIRVFFSTTCTSNFGRLTFVDLNSDNPSQILINPRKFILDIGDEGSFDDSGVNPSSIIKIGKEYFLYYAGYQRHIKTPYSIFTGLAISNDLLNFERFSRVPILERTSEELSLRSAPSVIFLDKKYFMVYVSDFGWREIESPLFKGKKMPQYCIKQAVSENGINWVADPNPIICPSNDEFGFGRPYLIEKNNLYYLFYSIRRTNISYRIGYAISYDNCKTWTRCDNIEGLDVSSDGWDNEMLCYAAPITINDKSFIFYNGNNNGESGFGYAEIIDWEK